MNVRYTEYVLPEVESWNFRPSREQLAAIFGILEAGQWLLSDSDGEVEFNSYVSIARARQLARATPTNNILSVLLGAPPGADEWPDEQPEFTAEVCEEVRIIDSPKPLIVPAGEADLALPCPSCDVDLLEASRSSSGNTEIEELAECGFYLLPQNCSSCKATPSPEKLAAFSHEELIDDVPIFRFCIALAASCQPAEAWVTADPALLSSLESVTATPFRSMGRWAF